MKFLKYTTTRIVIHENLHDWTLERIVILRNALQDLRKLRKLDSLLSFTISWDNDDFRTVWINPGLENDLIESLNRMIIARKTK